MEIFSKMINELKTNYTIYLSIITILISTIFFLINKGYSAIKDTFKIGIDTKFDKSDILGIFLFFLFGFALGFSLFITEIKYHNIWAILLLIIAFSSLHFIIKVGIRENIIKFIGNKNYRLLNFLNKHIFLSTLTLSLITFICGFFSASSILVVKETESLIFTIITFILFFIFSFTLIGGYYNLLKLSNITKSCITLTDDKLIYAFIIDKDDKFLIIKNSNSIEYININIIKKIS